MTPKWSQNGSKMILKWLLKVIFQSVMIHFNVIFYVIVIYCNILLELYLLIATSRCRIYSWRDHPWSYRVSRTIFCPSSIRSRAGKSRERAAHRPGIDLSSFRDWLRMDLVSVVSRIESYEQIKKSLRTNTSFKRAVYRDIVRGESVLARSKKRATREIWKRKSRRHILMLLGQGWIIVTQTKISTYRTFGNWRTAGERGDVICWKPCMIN